MNQLFLFKIVLLSYLLHYQPCEAAFGLTLEDSKKASLRVLSLGRNRVFPLYAVPPEEDLTATLMAAPLLSSDFLKYLLIELANGKQAVSLATFFTLTTMFVNVKIDTNSLIQQGSKLEDMMKEIKAEITSTKMAMAQLGSMFDKETKEIKAELTSIKTDMEKQGSKFDKETKEIKGD